MGRDQEVQNRLEKLEDAVFNTKGKGKGPKGDTGPAGPQGKQGPAGPAGKQGPAGKTAKK